MFSTAVWCSFICHGCEIPSPGMWIKETDEINFAELRDKANAEGWRFLNKDVMICPECKILVDKGTKLHAIPRWDGKPISKVYNKPYC